MAARELVSLTEAADEVHPEKLLLATDDGQRFASPSAPVLDTGIALTTKSAVGSSRIMQASGRPIALSACYE